MVSKIFWIYGHAHTFFIFHGTYMYWNKFRFKSCCLLLPACSNISQPFGKVQHVIACLAFFSVQQSTAMYRWSSLPKKLFRLAELCSRNSFLDHSMKYNFSKSWKRSKIRLFIRLVSYKAKSLFIVRLYPDIFPFCLVFYQFLIHALALLEYLKRIFLDSCDNDSCKTVVRLVFGKSL